MGIELFQVQLYIQHNNEQYVSLGLLWFYRKSSVLGIKLFKGMNLVNRTKLK